MRLFVGFLALLSLGVAGCADYEGDIYDQVVRGREVKLMSSLPAGYHITGRVSADGTYTGAADGAGAELWCYAEKRLKRRMRREAAQNGGELLIGFDCFHEESERLGITVVDGEVIDEVKVDCETLCFADVARQISRDE